MKFAMNTWSNCYLLKEDDEITLLGSTLTTKSQFEIEHKNKLLHALFTNIIWISYRKNFTPLLPSLCGSEFISDTGWGCMIRVGKQFDFFFYKFHK